MNPPPELAGPITLEIGLDWFFDRHIRGIHGFATVSREFGLLLQAKDPLEAHLHVELPPERPALAEVYPKHLWLEAVARMDRVKQQSELERQRRFESEAKAKELQIKFALREAEIERVTRLFYTRLPQFTNKHSNKQLRMFATLLLQGSGNKELREKLGICVETVNEFLALPQPKDLTEEELLIGLVQEKPSTEIRVI